ncbi:MAG: hypothetical protein J07HQX50_01615 [Haloquadratum sp. J07HQX50]|jgi:hypothetical protein|nr:MAG: hypothetical protein J07HQX50_01615 [Haloquadratum sp. J07HQX50]
MVIDATEPEDGTIRGSLREQLKQHGLVASTMNNLQQGMRKRADLK